MWTEHTCSSMAPTTSLRSEWSPINNASPGVDRVVDAVDSGTVIKLERVPPELVGAVPTSDAEGSTRQNLSLRPSTECGWQVICPHLMPSS
jgi:hypothetical protein